MANLIIGILSWLQGWSAVISSIGSLILTSFLVILYYRQNSIQEDQQDLLRRELNREVRQGHSETLKKRIRAWHGDMDEVSVPETGWFSDETNLPKVQAATVDPAPPILHVAGQDPEFRVVPEAIEDDRYLQDLLDNHASDLYKLKEEIESQYSDFVEAKEAFVTGYPEATAIETDSYAIRPRSEFAKWVFERAVMLNRAQVGREKEKLKHVAESRIRGRNSANSEKAMKFYSPTGIDGAGPSTYEIEMASGNFEELAGQEDEILEKIVEIHWTAIDNIGDDDLYDHTVEGADILDAMAGNVEELKAKLVEHEGHPIYLEDCEYLEEVTI